MLKSFIKLIAQKMFCPILLEALEVYHSTKSIRDLLGETFYPLLFAVLVIGLKLIEVSLKAQWLQPLAAKHEKDLLYIGYAVSIIGLVSNLISHYHEHITDTRNLMYWIGFTEIGIILVCYERLTKIVSHLKVFRKWSNNQS